jgi:hypothetical protein
MFWRAVSALQCAYMHEIEEPPKWIGDTIAAISAKLTDPKSTMINETLDPVATVKSWTNGSYWRNYKLEWHKDVSEGTKLYAAPQGQPRPGHRSNVKS